MHGVVPSIFATYLPTRASTTSTKESPTNVGPSLKNVSSEKLDVENLMSLLN